MAKNLEELREELYENFNMAKEKVECLKHINMYSWPEPSKAAAQLLQGMATTASAIVEVEHELAEQNGLGEKIIAKPRANPQP